MKVVCINNKTIKRVHEEEKLISYHLGDGLVKGEIYTVIGFCTNKFEDRNYIIEGVGKKLVERFRPCDDTYGFVVADQIEKQVEFEYVNRL